MRRGVLLSDLATGFGILLSDLTAAAIQPPRPAPHTLLAIVTQPRATVTLVHEPSTLIALLLEEP